MQQENALIGVAVAAYYPDISLSALGGFVGNPIGQLLNAANRVWSLGASASETLFEGGLRPAQVAAARASYDQTVATYRQTVLVAFQQVEDELAALRIYERQAAAEAVAVASAQRAVAVALNEYRAGTVAYTSVITEQEQLLSNEQAQLSVLQNRFIASAALVQALGGGWNTALLPSQSTDPGLTALPIRVASIARHNGMPRARSPRSAVSAFPSGTAPSRAGIVYDTRSPRGVTAATAAPPAPFPARAPPAVPASPPAARAYKDAAAAQTAPLGAPAPPRGRDTSPSPRPRYAAPPTGRG